MCTSAAEHEERVEGSEAVDRALLSFPSQGCDVEDCNWKHYHQRTDRHVAI